MVKPEPKKSQRRTVNPGTIAYAVQVENFKREYLQSSPSEDHFDRFFPSLSDDTKRKVDAQVDRCFLSEDDLNDPDFQELLEFNPEASEFIKNREEAPEKKAEDEEAKPSVSFVPTTFSHQRYLKHAAKCIGLKSNGVKKTAKYPSRTELGKRIKVTLWKLSALDIMAKKVADDAPAEADSDNADSACGHSE